MSRSVAVVTLVASSLLASGASAQNAKAAPAQMVYEAAFEVSALPGDGETTTLKLAGLKTAHAAWITFVKFAGSAAARDSQVMALMEGVTVKWSGGKESCVYELRMVASPPAITLNKSSGMCALKPPGAVVFQILAM